MPTPLPPFVPPPHWHARPCRHHSPRTRAVECLVLHADASPSVAQTLGWLADRRSEVSYHVLVGRTGMVYLPVHPDRVAWHAGVSEWRGRPYVNGFSVGVCLSNRNDGVEAYPAPQVEAAAEVCAVLCAHYRLEPDAITTHAEVARPVGRKTDPVGLDLVRVRARVATLLVTTRRGV